MSKAQPKSSQPAPGDGLASILNAVGEGLCGLDATGHITFCNDVFLQMTGYESAEIAKKDLHDLLRCCAPAVAGESAPGCLLRKFLKSPNPVHASNELFYRKDRSSFPAEYWLHPLVQPAGSTASILTVRDRTSSVQDQKARARREGTFQKILNNVPDVAWTTDSSGHTIYISSKVESVIGYSPAEICAAGPSLWLGRIHSEDVDRVTRAFGVLFENQGSFDEEYRIRRKDESWIWVHDRATVTREEDGTLYADGIFSDITGRKQAEMELQAKTAFLEAQSNSTIDGMLVLGLDNQRILLNQRLIKLFSIPPDIAANPDGTQLLDHLVSLVKDPELFLREFRQLDAHARQTSHDEVELMDGSVLERHSSPVVDSNGSYHGRIWTFRDITERRRGEDALQQLSLAVEQSPVTVIITDPQGRISYVNRKFTECTGYTHDEAVGRTPALLQSGQTPLRPLPQPLVKHYPGQRVARRTM